MTHYVFFYGTLMAGFDRRQRAGIDAELVYRGRGHIAGALFDLGLYPAAIPASDGLVWGELYEIRNADRVLPVLDDIEGYSAEDPDHSLYVRERADVIPDEGVPARAWVYFYNAPLGRAPRIPSGDYRAHIHST